MITIANISVVLRSAVILSDISFTARPGRLTAIAGPSGSGKTTLLKVLSGELRHRGTVTINGKPLATTDAKTQAGVRGVLPQHSTLAFPFSVSEVVALGQSAGQDADIASGPGKHKHGISQALARVGLEGFDHRSYLELSGGEQQRVQLARVLCQIPRPVVDGEPRWLFLDEPVSSLDICHQLAIMQLARDFADAGGGVIAVMHDLNLTSLFADDIALMTGGRLHGFGPLLELLDDRRLQEVFGCRLKVNGLPENGRPFVLPHTAV